MNNEYATLLTRHQVGVLAYIFPIQVSDIYLFGAGLVPEDTNEYFWRPRGTFRGLPELS